MKVDLNINNYFYKKIKYKNTQQINIQSPIKNDKLNNKINQLNFYSNNLIAFRGNEIQLKSFRETTTKPQEDKLAEMLTLQEGKDIPSLILLYSEDDKKSAELLNRISTRTNSRIVELETDSDNYASDTYKLLKKSKENYLNNGQRTLIVVKNSDFLLSDSKINYGNITMMKSWLDNSAKEPVDNMQNAYGATFIIQTDNPKAISPELLQKEGFGGVIDVKISSVEDIKNLINLSIANSDYSRETELLSEEELNQIAQYFTPNKISGGFSDNKIILIVNRAIFDWQNQNNSSFYQVLNEKINSNKRDIAPRIISRFFESRKWLVQNGLAEMPDFKNINLDVLNEIEGNCSKKPFDKNSQDELSQIISSNTDFIQNADNYNIEKLRKTIIKGKSLVDFWLEISQDDIINQGNQRLKNMWFEEVLQDKTKTGKLISKSLDILQKENGAIEITRKAYTDIIENDETISKEQKAILIQQQESKLFFDIISHKINTNSLAQIEDKILSTIELLAKEKERVSLNAKENIFEPAKDVMILSSEDSDDIAIVDYIFQLLSKASLDEDENGKNNIKLTLQNLRQAKEIGDIEQLEYYWQNLVDIAKNYFLSSELDNLTNRNIELLNSINQKKNNINDKTIIKTLDNPSLSIEQKEFVARYANNDSFKLMLKNPNIDITSVIEDLVFFEAGNEQLIFNSNLEFSGEMFNKMMSDKFRQINQDARDITIQGNKIISKLDEINSSINSQSELISEFANNFSDYANQSLSIQEAQLSQLIEANKTLNSIDLNTKEMNSYLKVITRTKLLELQKDKYFKDIVPELTQLLPQDEQIDIQDFLSKIDDLAKREKNAQRKQKLIKAGIIIAATVAAGAGIYYFGPAVVAHLFSKVANPINAASAISSAASSLNIARKVGSKNLTDNIPFGHYSSNIKILQNEISDLERKIEHVKNMIDLDHSDSSRWINRLDYLMKELAKHRNRLQKALNKIK